MSKMQLLIKVGAFSWPKAEAHEEKLFWLLEAGYCSG
jgi:hypothetical protein